MSDEAGISDRRVESPDQGSDSWSEGVGEGEIDQEVSDTIEEEESREDDEEVENEVGALKEEQDLPIEELMRKYYGYNNKHESSSSSGDDVNNVSSTDQADNLDVTTSSGSDVPDTSDAPDSSNHVELSGGHGYFSDVDEGSDDDDEYVPPEHWKKFIKVGPEHQVQIPDCTGIGSPDIIENGLSADQKEEAAESADPDPDKDCLLWKPNDLNDTQIEQYLRSVYVDRPPLKKPRIEVPPPLDGERGLNHNKFLEPNGHYLRDDEDALYLLLKSQYNLSEALSRYERMKSKSNDTDSVVCPTTSHRTEPIETADWSDEECTLFEDGLRQFGKNFTNIHKHRLPKRSVGELVHFYYLWKKTERHDLFVQRVRFEKRQYLLHPTATDYMDHFISQMDAAAGISGHIHALPPVALPDHPEQPTSTSLLHNTSLISSDPKHCDGRFHQSHFNEWSSTVPEHMVESTSPHLPQLDSYTVDSILETAPHSTSNQV